MSDRKLYIELSTEEYQNFLQSEEIIKGLISKLEQEKIKNSGIKVIIDYNIRKEENSVRVTTSYINGWEGQKPIVDTKLQELLVREISSLSDKRDSLEKRVNSWNKKSFFQKLILIFIGYEI